MYVIEPHVAELETLLRKTETKDLQKDSGVLYANHASGAIN